MELRMWRNVSALEFCLLLVEEVSCEMSVRLVLLCRSTDGSWNWLPGNLVCLF